MYIVSRTGDLQQLKVLYISRRLILHLCLCRDGRGCSSDRPTRRAG